MGDYFNQTQKLALAAVKYAQCLKCELIDFCKHLRCDIDYEVTAPWFKIAQHYLIL